MGHGITLAFARAGYPVSVFDPDNATLITLQARVKTSMISLGESELNISNAVARISICDSLEACVAHADFVTEAAPERLAIKQQIFAAVEAAAPAHCILASNTSVIPITQIMDDLNFKARTVGTHWWNPAHLIPLVEVIRTEHTSEETMSDVMELLADIDKTPVRVEKDVPGFIGNRLQHALWREAISLVENGICDAEAVDTVVKSSFGRRLAVLGPLENADLVGTDLTLDIHNNVLHDIERSSAPSPYLSDLVEQGRLGMKSGQGFYQWQDGEADSLRQKVNSHLMALKSMESD